VALVIPNTSLRPVNVFADPSNRVRVVLLRTREVPVSSLGLETGILTEVFRGSHWFLRANAGNEPYIRPLPLSSTSVPTHNSLIMHSVDAVGYSLSY
jgi:hypothetical protein